LEELVFCPALVWNRRSGGIWCQSCK